MSFFTNVGSYDLERIADLKSMINYGRRTVSRLQEELKILQQTIEKEVISINNVNILFATSKASSYCTNQQSPVFKTLTKEISPPSDEDESTEIIEPEYPLFKYPNTEEILDALKQSIDFQEFFQSYPLGFLAFFDNSPILFNTDTLISEIETWDTDRRLSFFSAFFENLNSVAFYFSSLLQIVESRSIALLSEFIETGLSTILNCQKVAFFLYDSEEQELVMEKQKLQMRRRLQSGIVHNSLIKNELLLVSKNFPEISKDDLSLLKNNKTILSIPIYCDKTPTALILLYDKIGGFGTFDYLIGSAISRFITQTLPIIHQRNDRETSLSNLSNSLDIFLQIIGSKDLDALLDVISDNFTEYFQCEYAKLFHVSPDLSYFSLITKDGNHEKNPISNSLIGRSIQQKSTIKLTHPELSDSFSPLIDRPTPNCIAKSILISPILDENKPAFVIVLYNKKELETFTDIDLERIKMIGEHLNSILYSLLKTSHLTVHAMHGSQKLVLYKSMFDMLHKMSASDSFKESVEVMKENIMNSFPDTLINIFYIDHFNKLLKSADNNLEDRLSYDNPDPIIHFATTSETKEAKRDEESRIYSGLRDLSKQPIGLLKIETCQSNQPNEYAGISMYDSYSTFSGDSTLSRLDSSRTSCPQSARHKWGKSSVQKKVEKLHQIQDSQYSDINSKYVSNIVTIWHDLIGPVLELSMHRYSTLNLIRICDNLIEKLPNDPQLAVSIFEEMQFMMNSAEKSVDDGLIMTFIDKNDEYYQKTKKMLVSYRLLLSSSQIEFSNKDDQVDQISINNSITSYLMDISNFNVFNMKPDIFNDFLLTVLSDFHILRFLSIDRNIAMLLINNLKSMHVTTDTSYKSWELVIDHIQFLSYILKRNPKLLPVEKVASLFLYFLSLYCIPYQNDPVVNIIPNDKSYSQYELIRKYYIENGEEMSPLSCFIAAVAGLPNPSVIKNETIDIIAPLIKDLEKSQSFDFLNSEDTFCYLGNLAHFSYLSRLPDISKQWYDLRYREEFECEDDEQVMRFQLDYELKTIILPTFAEFAKKDLQLDSIQKLFTSTIQKFVGS